MSDNDKLHYTICAISGFLVALITYWITGKIMPGGSITCGFFSPVLGNTKWYSPLAGMVFGFIGFLNLWSIMA